MMNRLSSAAMKPASLLVRLGVVLALAFLGGPQAQGHPDRPVSQAAPAAETQIAHSYGKANLQRFLLRIQNAGDQDPDPAVQVADEDVSPALVSIGIASGRNAHALLATNGIRPPVRGPPAV